MIGLLGISYKTAPIDKREIFSFKQDEIIPFADFLQQETDISDIVLLSTCNRTELYFSQTKYDRLTVIDKVEKAFKQFKKAEDRCSRYLYHKVDIDAVRHLFTVASGIDSMIIGEDQILGQIKEAYLYCTQAALTDAILMRLFQKSFETGKRARTETGIKLGNLSVSSTAVELCANEFGNLKDKSVLIIGAGNTGSLALQNIVKKGIGSSTVINRTEERAIILANHFNSQLDTFENIEKQLALNDIIIVATSANSHIITKEMMEKNTDRPHILIDLSVPRNIDETITELPNIKLFAVDDLQDVVCENTERRRVAAEKAKLIIDEVVFDYNEWLISRSLRPAIKTISNNLRQVYLDELENYQHFESEKMKIAVENYTKHITQRYTRLLITNLKEITDNGRNTDSLSIINDLFKLDENNRRNH
jgi:glutamyl-tRNA reductase